MYCCCVLDEQGNKFPYLCILLHAHNPIYTYGAAEIDDIEVFYTCVVTGVEIHAK